MHAVQATSPAAMFAVVGVDSWVVVPIASTSRKEIGHTLEGTRLTITRSRDQADAYEFSIRTPVTPARWEDFDKELTHAFEAICAAAIADGVPLTCACLVQRRARGREFTGSYCIRKTQLIQNPPEIYPMPVVPVFCLISAHHRSRL